VAWRLARSLEQLRQEVNAAAPKRSKASDGTIGDPDHASRPSRHNKNRAGVVCALDLTNDPVGGVDIHAFARRHVKNPHPNLEYVISDGEVAKRKTGFRWEKYRGANPHRKHAHFAVGLGPDSDPAPPYDDQTPWGFSLSTATPSRPVPPSHPEDDDLTPEQAQKLDDIHAALSDLHRPGFAGLDAQIKGIRRVLRLIGERVGIMKADLDKAERGT